MQPGFSIHIFMPDGSPEGLRIVTRDGWKGCAVVCPRALLADKKQRREFGFTGVYALVGTTPESDLPLLYIGHAGVVRKRLESHAKEKDFWTWTVFFTTTDDSLNTAQTGYLEAQLIKRAHEVKAASLTNDTQPADGTLNEADQAYMDSFFDNILSILPLLGISAFELPSEIKAATNQPLLYIKSKGIHAKGRDQAKFVVYEGSQAVVQETPSIPKNIRQLRRELGEKAVLVLQGSSYRFTQDYTFSSPSAAAAVVLGASANGRDEWKDAEGRTLKFIQQSAVA